MYFHSSTYTSQLTAGEGELWLLALHGKKSRALNECTRASGPQHSGARGYGRHSACVVRNNCAMAN